MRVGRREKTKVLCTVGPVSMKLGIMRRLHRAGMDGVRINTAYGDFDQYAVIVENSRAVGEIPVVLDIKGPEVRTSVSKPLRVERGDEVLAGFGGEELSFSYDFFDKVRAGDRILIDNGTVETRIKRKERGRLRLAVMNEGTISDRRGVNIPHRRLDLPGLSKRDLKVIDFARRNKVGFLALSFTRNAEDVLKLRELTRGFEPAIMAKIENSEGVRNIEQIIDCADAVMVARGDLGVEMPSERVPLIQKKIIRRCNQRGKTAVTATQMLESMMKNPFPTRAETSDVANAILDGSDAVMLSGETSVGRYPVESVRAMSRIAREAERAVVSKVQVKGFENISTVISDSVRRIAQGMPLDKIVTITRSGYTARMIARFRVKQPVIAVTYTPEVRDRLQMVWGVKPLAIKRPKAKDLILHVARILLDKGLVDEDDTVLFTAGVRTTQKHASNHLEIHTIRELLTYGRGSQVPVRTSRSRR